MARWTSRAVLALGCLLIAAGAGYGGWIAYLSWQESVAPSTQQVLALKDGRRVVLRQPTPVVISSPAPAPTLPTAGAGALAPPAAGTTPAAPALTVPTAPAALPPVRVRIPRIGVDWPVVLSDNADMPRFKGVGWLFGSAYPGWAGNMVLFGHLDGPYATFGRLPE